MLTMLTIVMGFIAPPDGPKADPLVSPSEFRAWFDAAREGNLNMPADVERTAQRFRYVFVGGFGSERMPGYFARNAKELRARGVSRHAIHFVFPSSHETFEENADEVRERFFAIAREGRERLVVIAHSRGACDALSFALREPEFVRDRVEALFLVQGAFGGTVLADYIRGEGPSMDRMLPIRFRIVVHLLGQFERLRMRRGWHGGLPGLSRGESREYWSRLMAENADAIPIVGPKTYYIQSEVRTARLGMFRRAVGKYLTAYDGPNDGVVAVPDQQLPGLGTSLGVFDCGHGDLTGGSRSSRASRRLQGVLIQSILMAVGKSDPESSEIGVDRAAREPAAATHASQTRRVDRRMVPIAPLIGLGLMIDPPTTNGAEDPAGKVTHRFLATGGETYIRDGDGTITWRYPLGSRDGWVLPNGNVLLALSKSKTYPGGGVVEVTKDGKTVFEYKGTQSEVNTVQETVDGSILLSEAGDKPRLLEVDRQGRVIVKVPLRAQTRDHHLQTRMSRKLANGNYLVPQLLDKVVREYTPGGEIVWEAKTPDMPFTAIRLENGNTLIGCTLGNLVVEVDPKSRIVWQVSNDDLPGDPINDACGVQRLANGNTVIASHHAKGDEIKLLEVTPEKKLVWVHRAPTKPSLHHFQILDTNGTALEGTPLR